MVWYANSAGRFGASGAKGDAGEELVKQFFTDNNIPFEHKTDYKSQVIDKIDFIVNGVPADVKTNFYKGYLAVELWDNKKQKRGWLWSTSAQLIYGVDLEGEAIYVYNVNEMREFVLDNLNKTKTTKNGDVIMWVNVLNPIIKQIK
jgi:hypothetical protein